MMDVRTPQFGMTMETAEVIKWLYNELDYVKKGDPLVELQNDKAVVPIESPGSGYLKIIAREGDELQIGDLLAVLLDSPDENTI